jgi:type VI protein secretion system component Hcp
MQQGLPQPIPGNLRVIDSPSQSCNTIATPGAPATEQALSWNTIGQPGPPGATGATGPQGPAGRTLTISGSTFTLANGHTFTISGQPLIAPLPTSNGPAIATLTLGSGRGALTFDIQGYAFAPTQIGSGTQGAGSGKAKFGEFTIKKTIDSASAKLMQSGVTGAHYKTVILHVRKAGKSPYLTFTFTNAYISSYQAGGHAQGDKLPEEAVTFTYAKETLKYGK